MMHFVCSDLEGVFIPEIWKKIAIKTRIKELKMTTRECPDFNFLMKKRIKLLKEHNLKIYEILKIVKHIKPFKGAAKFLKWLRENFQLLIISDSFYEFLSPLLKELNYPTILCNSFIINKDGFIVGYRRIKKEKIINFLRRMQIKVIAIGDSYNDLEMIKNAEVGIFFNPSFKSWSKKIKIAKNYPQLKSLLKKFLNCT